jgi:hypothetical protein
MVNRARTSRFHHGKLQRGSSIVPECGPLEACTSFEIGVEAEESGARSFLPPQHSILDLKCECAKRKQIQQTIWTEVMHKSY